MTKSNGNLAVIGRGESILTNENAETGKPVEPPPTVTEGDEESADKQERQEQNEEAEIAAIQESAGWIFPKIKLAFWDPENEKQWDTVGKNIARRNLIASIPNLTCAFGVWLVWSGKLTDVVFEYMFPFATSTAVAHCEPLNRDLA